VRRLQRGFAHFEAWRDDILAEEERERTKLDRWIEAEEHWMRYGVTARRKRNMRRVARLGALRQRRREASRPAGQAVMNAAAERLGALAIESKGLTKSYGSATVVSDFSIRIERGDRIGIVGPNGSGKTTLADLLTGALAPDAGTVRHGANLSVVTLDQRRDSLNPDRTVSEELTGGRGDTVMIGGQVRHLVGYMRDFLFDPKQARTPVRALSGGERGRLMLAQALARPSNLLVLDEPTNDLDVETLDVLEEMLAGYAGTVLLISHDRDFLDRIVSAVFAPEGNGRWVEYAGGYTDMLTQRGADLRHSAIRPAAAAPMWEANTRDAGAAAGRVEKPAGRQAIRPGVSAAGTSARSRLKSAEMTPIPSGEFAGPAVQTAGATRRKLSFKDKHALEVLPGKIAVLEAKIARLQTVMSDPTLFARDRVMFDRTSRALAGAQAELVAAEERWLELELLRSEVEGGQVGG
jgi:ABC transport system ATP-binding/permease protein